MSVARSPSVSWDVFHAESLELERGLSTAAVRAALAGGVLRDDDLVRPAGSTVAWSRLAEIPELCGPAEAAATPAPAPPASESKPKPAAGPEVTPARPPKPEPPPARRAETSDFELDANDIAAPMATAPPPKQTPPTWMQLGGGTDDVTFPVVRDQPPEQGDLQADSTSATAWKWAESGVDDDEEEDADEPVDDDFDDQIEILDNPGAGLEILDEDELAVPSPFARESFSGGSASRAALPVVPSRDWNEDRPPIVDGEEEGDFTLSRSGPMTVEELDLAPMVDVAFQLVLFFMVTATTVLFKTLEIPKPSADPPPGAVAQGQSRSLDDFKDDYVLVEIDAAGSMKIDHEPVASELNALAERLRTARERTGRKAMLLSADSATPHRHAVLAYDAANEIGMLIAIAKPSAPQGAGPGLLTGSGKSAQATGAAASSPPRTAPGTREPASGGTPIE